jgi:hypothetical protein
MAVAPPGEHGVLGPDATVGGDDESASAPLTADEAELIAAGLDSDPTRRRLRPALRRSLDRAIGFVGFGPGGAGAAGRRKRVGSGITIVLQPNGRTLPLFGILTGTLIVAMLGGVIANAAFVARYAAVVLPLFLLIAAMGVSVFDQRRVIAGTVAVMCVAGLLTGYGTNVKPRSQAVQVAQVLNAQAKPGDLVVYCPDQTGPAVDRLLKVPGVTELTFPRAIGPQRVDWINYTSVIDHTNIETFAQDVLTHVGANNTVWLVWSRNYYGLGNDCGDLDTWLSYFQGAGTTLVQANSTYYENEMLTRFPNASTS